VNTTTIHTRSVAGRFSSAAATYDQVADLQGEIARQLARWLPSLPAGAAILDIGCGTGNLTRLLAGRYPAHPIDAIDLAPGMVSACRRRLAEFPRVVPRLADALSFAPDRRYGLVASSSALQWVQPLDQAFRQLGRFLEPDGRLVCAMLVEGTLAELLDCRRTVAPDKPPRVTLATAGEVLRQIDAAGLDRRKHDEAVYTIEYPGVEHLLRRLHAQGVTGGWAAPGGRLLNRTELGRLMDEYQSRYSGPGGAVLATYRVLYFSARTAPNPK
jgi:malonyl-CoA O-methyltransferase